MADKLDLQVNGRLFPSWMMKNFKKYTLPEIIRKEGEDPCNEVFKKDLTMYQKFLGQYLSYKSPFKDILVYHGLGSGKTVSAIGIYNILFNYTPKWNVFLLIKASLKNDPWLKDLGNWLDPKEKDLRMKNINFISYDAPNADSQFLEAIKKSDSSKSNLFIFDEAHNFIRNVYGNITSKKGKRAQVIYDYIVQEKKETGNARVILLTATPAINQPYELALIFNLLRPGSFPDNESMFNQIYISSSNFVSLNEETKNMFQRRILGLSSYYIGATPDKFADKIVHYVDLDMNPYYKKVYEHFEEVEEAKEKLLMKMSRGRVGENEMSTYKTYTRQSSNFVFPTMSSKLFGEKRPRPGQFRIKIEEANVIDEGKDIEIKTQLTRDKQALKDYEEALNEYIKGFIAYCEKARENDKNNNKSIQNDVKIFHTEYNGNIKKFLIQHKATNKMSSLLDILYTHSPKMVYIILKLLRSTGPVLVYSNYVKAEGIQLFKIYSKFFGFMNVVKDPKLTNKKQDYFRYMEYHGGIDAEIREKYKKIFNDPSNKYAEKIKIILISPAGSEGINLKNTRQVHLMEPYWNEVRIEQIIGRAIRQCSHADLPMNERKVDVYRYKMIRKNGKQTTDQEMESISRKKNNLIQSFLEAVREASVDCELFKNHNMMGLEYNCFKFNQENLLEKPIGPAFLQDEEFDTKINNGSNSIDAITKQIKVKKINIVISLDENNYSEKTPVWYHPETHFVYEKDLHYPIGKVKIDNASNPIQIEDGVYLVEEFIKIPEYKLFD
ncbi:putative superfamily II helicase/VV D11-like transcription factor [Cafeteria roenbergensis virus]|uniref:Putative superfamily II helicase/VV D11-like transcription factor n=1 Tax=Cafeteria roenbergensis virus (strain BV-PW1) TaxID=693272 RepID=E3T553_CROVB|nr:putative superfamily II helicase/VV D11-like transcription factor [Cafeteria roenbergensis virus BV-PW1]ADO67316.1 putative superfamily II helicase/VV D11-like transcription factor [Cafeteria roenbergensis virus BV-PW1]